MDGSTERIEAYAQSFVDVAVVEGHLAEVEDDLFRFARTLEGSDELRMALTDPQLPVERRLAVVEDLMGGKAMRTSVALVSLVVAAGRTHDLGRIVERFVARAAEQREAEVAEVRSAVPLDEAQQARLASALGRLLGKRIEVRVIVDESVLGGVVATVGDTVIDGSVRYRLEQMRERL